MNRTFEKSASAVGVLVMDEWRQSEDVGSIHLISAGTGGQVVLEVSNDGINWVSASMVGPGYGGTSVANLSANNTMGVFMKQSRYWRARLAALTSGTVSIVAATGVGWIK